MKTLNDLEGAFAEVIGGVLRAEYYAIGVLAFFYIAARLRADYEAGLVRSLLDIFFQSI